MQHKFLLIAFVLCIMSSIAYGDVKLTSIDVKPMESNEQTGVIRLTPVSENVEIMTEGNFSAAFTLSVPDAASLKAEAGISSLKECIVQQVDLGRGKTQITVNGTADAADPAPKTITLRLLDGNREFASAKVNIQFFSGVYTKAHLQSLSKALPGLREKMERLKAKGQDISYPMVTYTVLDSFIGYVNEDVDKGEIKRAVMQLTEMGSMGRQLEKELNEALQGKLKFPAVPKWTGIRPTIKGSSFIAPTATFGKPGSEIRPVFFNGYGHSGQEIEKFPGYGVNIMQTETGPWEIYPEEGKVNDAPIQRIKDLLDKAHKAGVAFDLLISPHYFPGWMVNKYPDLRTTNTEFLYYCLHVPEGQEFLKQYIAKLITPIKDSPALFSICLSNEPQNDETPCKYGAIDWHEWLKKKHGDINTLNARWGTDYKNIDDIPLPNSRETTAQIPMARWADYIRFNQEFFASWHKMLADAVHAIAPNVPVHAKMQTFTVLNPEDIKRGNDAYLYGQVTDINGNDSMCWYRFGKTAFANSWSWNAMGYDLQRSVKDAPVYNSENHIILDGETRRVPPEHVRAALWQQAIHGQSANSLWLWERSFDKKNVAYGSLRHRPACARIVGITNYDLNRAAREVAAIQQAPAKALILYDTSAFIYDADEYGDCMKAVYTALFFNGTKIGFITERQLENGVIPDAGVLCIPNAKHLSDAAFSVLQKYKGHVINIGDGELLTHNEYDKPRPNRIAGDYIAYDKNDTDSRQLSKALHSKLSVWNVKPRIEALAKDNQPVWGVEISEAGFDGGTVVNLCNYLNEPVSLRLSRNGGSISASDVLTGEKVSGEIKMQPLEVRLLKVKG